MSVRSEFQDHPIQLLTNAGIILISSLLILGIWSQASTPGNTSGTAPAASRRMPDDCPTADRLWTAIEALEGRIEALERHESKPSQLLPQKQTP